MLKDYKKLTKQRKLVVGKLVRKIRRGEDITQKDISKGLGHSQPVFMQRIEAGTRHLDVSELWELCQFMEVSFSEVAQKIDKLLKEHNNQK